MLFYALLLGALLIDGSHSMGKSGKTPNPSEFVLVKGFKDIISESSLKPIQGYCPTVKCDAPSGVCPAKTYGPKDLELLSIKAFSDPDVYATPEQLITSKGYPAERHVATTDDGAKITIFRIPYGRNNKPGKNDPPRPVILCQHGWMSQSVDWTTNFANNSWAFIFADNGYDVWMSNVRGNYNSPQPLVSQMNLIFNSNFTIDTHALQDLPAAIKLILKITKQFTLRYIGHSMGTTMMLALLSHKTEYNQNVTHAALLAPVMKLNCSSDGLKYLAKAYSTVVTPLGLPVPDLIPIGLLNLPIINLLLQAVCGLGTTSAICRGLLSSPCSNSTRYVVYGRNFPAGTSFKVLDHWAQVANSPSMAMYNYSSEILNKFHYGVGTPPVYDINLITTKIGLYHSCADTLADMEDYQFFNQTLKKESLLDDYLVPNAQFTHQDFVLSLDYAPDLIKKVLTFMEK